MNTILRVLLELVLRLLRSIDLPLLAALLALMGIGLATLYSASNESTRMLATQGAYFGIGLGMLWLASRIPAHVLKQFTPAVYVASLLPLVLVLFVGSGKYGNHWINLGFFNFQPSELAKLTLPMMLAWHLDRNRLPPTLNLSSRKMGLHEWSYKNDYNPVERRLVRGVSCRDYRAVVDAVLRAMGASENPIYGMLDLVALA